MNIANCPILVGHLNNLTKKGGDSAAIALALVAILDDVEGIAGLLDHEVPAERHAIERSKHIAEMGEKLQSLIRRSPATIPHAYTENDIGTDGCSTCGKAKAYKIHHHFSDRRLEIATAIGRGILADGL